MMCYEFSINNNNTIHVYIYNYILFINKIYRRFISPEEFPLKI